SGEADPDPLVQAVQSTVGELSGGGETAAPVVGIRKIVSPDPVDSVLSQLRQEAATLLVVGKHAKLKGAEADRTLVRQLFHKAPCDTILLRPGGNEGRQCRRILVPTSGGPHASVALQLAADVGQARGAEVVALFVEPLVGRDAEAVGQHILDQTVQRTLQRHREQVTTRVALANRVAEGIGQEASAGDYDLVLIGASNQGAMRRMLFGSVPQALVEGPGSVAVAVLRKAMPLTTRLQRAARRLSESVVPQLGREERVHLVERVQSNSQWDFDFVALVCLSSSIAALGLINDAAAVVIGAMLVAPLMTPLVGGGLALVQGNVVLIRHAARAIGFGFLLAFAIGLALGGIIPGMDLTAEMASRGRPNPLDLGVAFISGMAAAYATARPNLSAALPGVAIAAALVPPIATSGLALAAGEFMVSAGAALLFLTNIVAVVLGAAVSLFAVGLRVEHPHGREKQWTKRVVLSLVLAAAVLVIPLGYFVYASLPAPRVASEVETAIRQHVQRVSGGSVVGVRALSAEEPMRLEVTIEAGAIPPAGLAADLAARVAEKIGRPCRVRLQTRLVSESASP
ncbi:MAG: DUF389 domain-containing protein, partial [Phycisphaerae bacterium]|nr:DUF389 domain-containing protein [Phycisphaerae bacterium]